MPTAFFIMIIFFRRRKIVLRYSGNYRLLHAKNTRQATTHFRLPFFLSRLGLQSNHQKEERKNRRKRRAGLSTASGPNATRPTKKTNVMANCFQREAFHIWQTLKPLETTNCKDKEQLLIFMETFCLSLF